MSDTKQTHATDDRVSDGSTIASQPRMRRASWTRERVWRRVRYPIITLINLSVFAVLWEMYGNYGGLPDAFFPSFTEMAHAFRVGWFGGGSQSNQTFDLLQNFVIAQNFWVTLKIYVTGVLIAITAGIPIGLAMGGSKWMDAILSPYVWTLTSLPRIAIYPLLLIFLGIGEPIKYALVIMTSIFPVIINTWAGVKTTDRSLVNAAKVFGAGKLQVYRKVVLPYTLPFVVTGIQLGVSRGLVGVVIAEFLSGASRLGGIGWLIFRSAATFNSALTYAALVSLAIFALVMVQGTRSMEARIAPWRQANKA